MQDGIGVRVGLAVAAIAACVAGSIACSSASADGADGQSGAGAPSSAAPAGPAAPFPPPSPLPDGFNLDGGAAFDGNPAAFDSGIPSNPADDPPVDPTIRTMWAVDGANQLVRFTADAPGTVTARALTGLAPGERVMGIDIRPADGKLYAIGSTSRLYVVDRKTGVATAVGAMPFAPALAGIAFALAVNPVADKLRVQSDYDQNLRLDPVTGGAMNDGMLAFAKGDVNERQSPNLVASAYTNSVSPAPSATVLFAIDSTRNLLTRFADPNDGQVTTVGDLGVDTSDVAGFDICGGSKGLPMQAYALLMTDPTTTGLYTIDLGSGAATLLGAVGTSTALRGLAVEP
jgi:hypothetical protein